MMPTRRRLFRYAAPRLCALLLSMLLLGQNVRAQALEDPSPHSEAELVSEVSSIRPGEPFTVALRLIMETGWHSYWRNPGDAGGPTTIAWTLPDGFTAGEIAWPYPQRIDVPPLVSYGYYDEVLLLTDITPPAELPRGSTVSIEAVADWLICMDICLPATAEVSFELPVESATPDARWTAAFAETRGRLPRAVDGWEASASRRDGRFELRVTPPPGRDAPPDDAYFFAADEAVVAPSAPQRWSRSGSTFTLSLTESVYATGPVDSLRGVLLAPEGTAWDTEGLVRALAVEVPVAEAMAAETSSGGGGALAVALLFALAGGVLLNLMPCVFPVLSIKVLGFVGQGGEDRAAARTHGAAFGIGVVASFLSLGGVILALRAGGTRLGWGFQLQSPVFIAAMAGLFFVIALNLLGVFEVGTWLTRLGGRLAQPKSYGDSVASGVLATLVATPCTAPFMGTALGYALIRPPAETLFVFGALGIGMAAPYTLLSAMPALVARLPQPGQWMETLKQLLAFPLLGTVVWLVWVFGLQTGVTGGGQLLAALLLLSLAFWIVGRWHALLAGRVTRVATRLVAAVAVLLAVVIAGRGAASGGTVGVAWEPYSPTLVQEMRASGRPVFVDFTAAWCITCQVNEQVVLSSQTVERAFQEYGVAALKADWTKFDPVITDALEGFGRSGVPFYVLFSAVPDVEPVLLPTILSKRGVLDALRDLPKPELSRSAPVSPPTQ